MMAARQRAEDGARKGRTAPCDAAGALLQLRGVPICRLLGANPSQAERNSAQKLLLLLAEVVRAEAVNIRIKKQVVPDQWRGLTEARVPIQEPS